MTIPTPNLGKNILPPEVALLKTKEDIEAKPFLFSYEYYNDSLCEIDNLDKNTHKKVLKIFRKIGSLKKINQFKNEGIDNIPIYRQGDYKKLYNKLPLDVDLFEHKIQGTNRIFYSLIDRIFYIICFTHKHFETAKVRH